MQSIKINSKDSIYSGFHAEHLIPRALLEDLHLEREAPLQQIGELNFPLFHGTIFLWGPPQAKAYRG